MTRIVDLSMPIEDHFRWPVERRIAGSHAQGDVFEATWAGWTVHGFTHMDAARHCVPGGPTTEQIPLERTVGHAAVVDLTPIAPNEAISAARLAAAAGHVRQDDIVVMRSCWEQQRSPRTPEFWTDAPYMTREASAWLLEREPRAVAFDFPQDYPIRLLLEGKEVPKPEHVTHHVLLSHGVTLIEYVVNTSKLKAPRNLFSAAPLLIPNADGAPARIYAIEGLPV